MACRCPPLCSRTLLRETFILIVLLCFLLVPAATAATSARGVPTTTSPFSVDTPLDQVTVTCTAPCECLTASEASAKWGTSYSQCSSSACSYATDASGARTAKYCYKPATPVVARPGVSSVTTTLTQISGQLPTCGTGLTFCYGKGCVDLKTDTYNCGGCGQGCLIGQTCKDGKCTTNVKEASTAAVCAATGLTECGGKCADLKNDPENCGQCGGKCPAGNTCFAGFCQAGCPSGYTECQYGYCVDTSTDRKHCGACGQMCKSGEICCGGTCKAADDVLNCGACGKQCKANEVCKDSACTCAPGWGMCNPSEGCHNLQNDWKNCGTCGNSCSVPESCIDGQCTFEPLCGSTSTQTGKYETCADGIQNQGETGVDCGGKCPPCNTNCTTGTKYAPPDTPCTSVYHYESALPYVPSSLYPNDTHYADSKIAGCEICNYPCRTTEVCHPDLDKYIEEALKCCSLSSYDEAFTTMPDPYFCSLAISNSYWNPQECQKCTGLYIIYELSGGTRWMDGHYEGDPVTNPNYCWDLNNDGKIVKDDECQFGDLHSPLYNKVVADGGTPPPDTANYLLNFYHTGTCGDYATATTTLLRKAGFSQDDIGGSCDGHHCYNVVRLPGEAKWRILDNDAVQAGNGFSWSAIDPQSDYPYHHTVDENAIIFNLGNVDTGDAYTQPLSFTTLIPDINAYWGTVGNGQKYTYQKVSLPSYPICQAPNSPLPCTILYNMTPPSGPGIAGMGKDNWHFPDKGVSVNDIIWS